MVATAQLLRRVVAVALITVHGRDRAAGAAQPDPERVRGGELFVQLAHLWVGQDAVFNLRDLQPANVAVEQFCNRAAAEFLIPELEMRDAWRTARSNPEPYQAIARRFKVSELVGARRALDLKLITRDLFFDFYERYLAAQRRAAANKPDGGDFWATQNSRIGRAFGEAVVHAVKEGRLLYRDAFELPSSLVV